MDKGKLHRKTLQGTVISNKMDKTIVVEVGYKLRHPRYKKVIERKKKYFAHDESNRFNIGDHVTITESRPLSKLKRWRVEAK